ncbi:MAG: Flp pilus assembly protein CpaB [Terracidiphilus sp.]
MNRRLLAILLAALVIGFVCAFLVYQMVSSRLAAVRPVASTGVVAAKTDIKLGTVLSANDLMTVNIAGAVPTGAILVKDMSRAVGRGVISDLYAGEPIIENRLAAIGSGGGLAATIPPGMRACAVKVDDVVNVSGFVTPGMHVDVLISGTPPGATNPAQGQVSKTLLQDIKVLSAGTEMQKDPEGKPKPVQVVNLLVTPEDAEKLSLAANFSIRLVLRNPLDTQVGPVTGTDTSSLFTGMNTAPPKPQRVAAPKSVEPAPYSIEVINGTKTSEEKFASPEGHK